MSLLYGSVHKNVFSVCCKKTKPFKQFTINKYSFIKQKKKCCCFKIMQNTLAIMAYSAHDFFPKYTWLHFGA